MKERIITLEQFKKKMENYSKEQILEMLYQQCLKTIKIENKIEDTMKIINEDEYKI